MLLCGKQIGNTAPSHSQPCYVIGVYTWADWTKHGCEWWWSWFFSVCWKWCWFLFRVFARFHDSWLFIFLTGCFEQFAGWLLLVILNINEMRKMLQVVVRTKCKCMTPWALPDSYHLISFAIAPVGIFFHAPTYSITLWICERHCIWPTCKPVFLGYFQIDVQHRSHIKLRKRQMQLSCRSDCLSLQFDACAFDGFQVNIFDWQDLGIGAIVNTASSMWTLEGKKWSSQEKW